MKKLRLITTLIIFCFFNSQVFSQECNCKETNVDLTVTSGQTVVVNAYYPGSASVLAGSTSISLGSKRTFTGPTDLGGTITAGDLLMVIQMQGAEIDATLSDITVTFAVGADIYTTSDYGDGSGGLDHEGFLDNSNYIAGQFEFVVADNDVSVAGGTLNLTSALVNNYLANTTPTATIGRQTFQVIKVGNYRDVTVQAGGEITTVPWNGSTGGVISLDALGTLDLNGSIDADFAGFRGGFLNLPGGDNSDAEIGFRGEGIAGTPQQVYGYNDNLTTISGTTGLTQGYPGGTDNINLDIIFGATLFNNININWTADRGVGAPGNAGGGGLLNNGGGGGSNGSPGGNGANEGTISSGGGAILSVEQGARMFLGGGGGSGGQTDVLNDGFPVTTSSGRPGGGIILMRIDTLLSSGGTGSVSTNGDDGATFTATNATDPDDDGSGGGGGAGGTIILITGSDDFSNTTFSASGGDGAGLNGVQVFASPDGGGGGGSGGNVMLVRRGGEFSALPTIDVNGGVAGATQGTPDDSSTGGDGSVTLLTTPPAANVDCPLVTLAPASPAGVSSGLILWFRADEDVTFNGSNQISNWSDFSSSNFQLTNTSVPNITGTNPDYVNGSFSALSNPEFNFNPSVAINESGVTTDYLGFTNFNNQATSAITSFSIVNIEAGTPADQTIFSYLPSSSTGDSYDLTITDDDGSDEIREVINNNTSADATQNVRDNLTRLIASDYNTTAANIYLNNGSAFNTAVAAGNIVAGGLFVLGQDLDDSNSGTESFGSNELQGEIGEIIYYNRTLTAQERQRVSSYLAIKYGITLDQTVAQDYLNSFAETIFPATTETTYNNDIAGIGRDDASRLDQTTSKSINSDAVVTMSISSFTSDRNFSIWGNNNGTFNFGSGETNTSVLDDQLTREWRIFESNNPENLTVTVDLNGLTIPTGIVTLIIDDDGDFSGGTQRTISNVSIVGNVATFENVDFSSGEFFTFGVAPPSPGGVAGLSLWLKADDGTNTTTDGNEVTSWTDQSNNAESFTSSAITNPFGDGTGTTGPIYRESPDDFNFNPALDFNNGRNTDYLGVNSFGNFTGSEVTFFSVSQQATADNANATFNGMVSYVRADGTFDYLIFAEPDGYELVSQNLIVSQGTNDANFTADEVNILANTINTATDAFNIFSNGETVNQFTFTGIADFTGPSTFVLGQLGSDFTQVRFTNGLDYTGLIGEVVLFDNVLSAADRQKVDSYLAIKYGITLDQTTALDYLASNGTVVFPASQTLPDFTAFANDIAVIGRDDQSELNQPISQSINADAMVTITAPLGISNNFSFLAWGNDDASIAENVTPTDVPTNVSRRLNREWRVAKTGTLDNVTVQFDISSTSVTGTVASDFALMIDANGDFSNGFVQTVDASSFDGTTVTFTGVNFSDGDIFALGTSKPVPSPGGVSTQLALWLRADEGVTLSGSEVTSFVDQSPNANTYTSTAFNGSDTGPAFVAGTNNAAFNFNPSFTFTDDVLGNLSLTSSGSTDRIEFFSVQSQSTDNTNGGLFGHLINSNNLTVIEIDVTGSQYEALHRRLQGESQEVIDFIPNQAQILGYNLNTTSNTGTLSLNDESTTEVSINNPALTAFNFIDVSTSLGQDLNDEVGGGFVSGGDFSGDMAEVILYRTNLTSEEQQRVNSYLAVKYGITLNSGNTDIIASNGTTDIFPVTTDFSAYNNNITIIGRDDLSNLDQTQSNSVNSDAIVTISKNSAFNADLQFIGFGNDGGNFGDAITSDVPSGIESRIGRTWRLNVVNNPSGTVDLSFDLSGLTITISDPADLRLIVDSDDGNFSNSAIISGTFSQNGDVYTLAGIDLSDLPDNAFFSLASADIDNTPLPVELSYFRARTIDNNKSVLLEWETASEINNDYFVVEKSGDGIEFSELGRVNGSGNSTQTINYELTDARPLSGTSFYRLKQVDFDGAFEFSEILPITVNVDNIAFTLFPNPANDKFTLLSNEDLQGAEIRMTSIDGRTIPIASNEIANGSVVIETDHVPNGLYILEINLRGNRIQRKLIINHP